MHNTQFFRNLKIYGSFQIGFGCFSGNVRERLIYTAGF